MTRRSSISLPSILLPPVSVRSWLTSSALGLALWATTSVAAEVPSREPALRFEVVRSESLTNAGPEGRLFVVLSHTNHPEPRLTLGRTGRNAPLALAREVSGFAPGDTVLLDEHSFGFPLTNPGALPAGDYFVQALFDVNAELRMAHAPGNLYSVPQQLHVGPGVGASARLELTQAVPAEQLPPETGPLRFIKLPSRLLSEFHGRPMFLRAGLVLPRDYEREPSRHYPLWVRIGGLNARYSSVVGLMAGNSDFRKTWLADETPRFILLQLDGAGPYGDPYYVNSANNGPYGDALTQELIPYIEETFRATGQPRARVLSGSSTGGWVSLALQVFYPDFFGGTWSSCPDPVDFRALELVNIYSDTNAYQNTFGNERPSERTASGDVKLTMRQEVGVENLLGHGDSFTRSGGQWGAWNAVFGPRGATGLPVPIWDPHSGRIDHAVAEQWQKYDLRLVLEQNWPTLGPKLRGKIHIAAGEADAYFLNNAVHLLEDFLTRADPPFVGSVVYGPRKGHGWSNLSLSALLQAMQAATEQQGR